jgi:hypothetical protein
LLPHGADELGGQPPGTPPMSQAVPLSPFVGSPRAANPTTEIPLPIETRVIDP